MMQIQTPTGLQSLPIKGSWWRHKNGNLYQVISVSNLSDRQDEYPASVTYVGPNGKEWTKLASQFLQKMRPHSDALIALLVRHQGMIIDQQLIEDFSSLIQGLNQETEDHARQRTHYSLNKEQ